MTRCARCRKRFPVNGRGRPRAYCSDSCRQRAYELRRLAREYPEHMTVGEIREAQIEQRAERHAIAEARAEAAYDTVRRLLELSPRQRQVFLDAHASRHPSAARVRDVIRQLDEQGPSANTNDPRKWRRR
jgi:hypothetical protein